MCKVVVVTVLCRIRLEVVKQRILTRCLFALQLLRSQRHYFRYTFFKRQDCIEISRYIKVNERFAFKLQNQVFHGAIPLFRLPFRISAPSLEKTHYYYAELGWLRCIYINESSSRLILLPDFF